MQRHRDTQRFALHTLKPEQRFDIPECTGVYAFKDMQGRIIYIGKARSLRERVNSYFRGKRQDKSMQLTAVCAGLSYIATRNEIEAYLLEAEMIQAYQPVYNILLKHGHPFAYIVFVYHHAPAYMYITRHRPDTPHVYGPFVHRRHARRVYTYLQRTFQLKRCPYRIPGGCLDYHLGRCAGNCADAFDQRAYVSRLELAEKILAGEHEQYKKQLQERISQHNQRYEFEKAAHLYQYLRDMETICARVATRFSAASYYKEVMRLIAPHFSQPQELSHALYALQNMLYLRRLPRTIDCFDVSHFQSREIVGACVRFTDGMPDRNMFRRFRVRSLKRQDDYAALREIVSRRYRRDAKPDLVIIDGGKGQRHVIADAHPDLFVVSIAKRHETLYTPHTMEGDLLDLTTSHGQLLIALRDYTHHAAISYHRKRREKHLKAP